MIYTESVLVRDNIRADTLTILLLVGLVPFEPLLEFLREKCISLSSERSYARAAGRVIKWLSVRADEFEETSKRSLLYTSFVHDLRFGTYKDCLDVHGLNWTPISQQNLKRLL